MSDSSTPPRHPANTSAGKSATGAGRAKKATAKKSAAAAAPKKRSTSATTKGASTAASTRPAELGASSRAPRKRPSRKAVQAAAAQQQQATLSSDHTTQSDGPVPLRVVPDPPGPTPSTSGSGLSSAAATLVSAGGIEQGIAALVGLLRAAGRASGLDGDDLEQRVARTLSYLRRRISGDYPVDEFGFDPEFTEEVWLPLLRPIYRHWFRVEVLGAENVPAAGGALVVANHSGTVPIDGLMLQVATHDAIQRHIRALGADLVFSSPFVGELARKSGSTLATNADVERLLGQGELTAVFPEGFKGVGKGFSERYRLQRFGRGGFVAAALRSGVPIIPCSIVGAEEIYPMIGNLKSLARVLGFPYFPITPLFPLLGPLGAIPLPSKWIIEFGEPIDTASLGAEAAEDPMLVFDLSDQVRETIQQTLYSLLLRRRSAFF